MTIKILVVGSGSAGKRHFKNLKKLGVEVFVFSERKNFELDKNYDDDVVVFSKLNEALDRVDAVIIANSTEKHMPICIQAASQKKHLYIEKPISISLDGTIILEKIIKEKKLIVEVGCQLRADPNLEILSKILSNDSKKGQLLCFRSVVGHRLDLWRPNTDYKKSYSADVNRGGGALLDLIHEIDLLHWLIGDFVEVYAKLSKVSKYEINAEDLANLTITSKDGAVGQLQMDMISPTYRRELELIYQNHLYYWNYSSGKLIKKVGKDITEISKTPAYFNRNDLFMKLMKNFLSRIKDPSLKELCSYQDGLKALKTAIIAKKSNKSGVSEKILGIKY